MSQLSPFNDPFLKGMRDALQTEMTKALEPAIKNAVAEIEKDMRERLGAMVIRLLEKHYEITTDRDKLVIVVRREL